MIIAIVRALLAVPGHVMFAVLMGYYYGTARYADAVGDAAKCRINLRMALVIPTLLHGFYDFCLSAEKGILILCFFLFDLLMTIVAIIQFVRLSKGDTAIPVRQAEKDRVQMMDGE